MVIVSDENAAIRSLTRDAKNQLTKWMENNPVKAGVVDDHDVVVAVFLSCECLQLGVIGDANNNNLVKITEFGMKLASYFRLTGSRQIVKPL
jgi:hypothetical protein